MNPRLAHRLVPSLVLLASLTAQEPDKVPPTTTEPPPPIVLGEGDHRFEWVRNWGVIPDHELGNTHGCIAIDKAGNVYVNTDTERAVMVFSADGALLRSWGKEFKSGLHGMTLVEEGDKEFLYLAHTGRHEVVKATLDGEVVWTLGYPKTAGVYKSADQYRPTSVAVGPDGEIFVADGYGLSWVHQFDAERNYVRSFGGRGSERGQMQTPHGLWIDTRGDEATLIVCDRENHRLQIFDFEGKLLDVVEGMLRRPCNVHQHGDNLVVADLAGRITILDGDNKLVAHLGDNPNPDLRANNGVPRTEWRDGVFLAPHAARYDGDGNIYVMDWLSLGRVSKLRHVK